MLIVKWLYRNVRCRKASRMPKGIYKTMFPKSAQDRPAEPFVLTEIRTMWIPWYILIPVAALALIGLVVLVLWALAHLFRSFNR